MEFSEDKGTASQVEMSSVRYSLSAEGESPTNSGRFNGNDLRLQTENKPRPRYCTNCGNPLPDDCKFCPNCGHKVEVVTPPPPPPQSPSAIQREPTPSYMHSYSPPATPKRTSPIQAKTILIIAGIILALVIIIVFIDAIVSANSDLTPMPEPRSGEILSGTEDYYGSTITITASGGKPCVVKLKTSSGVTRLSFYVRAGDTVTVGVPCEYLYVLFASGSTWYGNEYLFGEYTDYQMVKDIRNFVDYEWEYELTPSSSGNFTPASIDEDDFK